MTNKTTATGYTKAVSFSKLFLTGNLAGLTVRETIKTTADAVALHTATLSAMQRAFVLDGKVARDLTGSEYRVYNIAVEDLA